MKSVAIVYVSLHGQTEKIAKHIKSRLESLGVKACLMDAEDSKYEEFPDGIDSVIIGGPVYMQKLPSSLIEWIPRHKDFLNSRPLGLFTVSMNAATQSEKARQTDDEILLKFIRKTGLFPRFVASFAGSLEYTDYNWLVRLMMKQIAKRSGGATDTSKDYEYTNWQMVDAFVESYVKEDRQSAYATQRRLKLEQFRPESKTGSVPLHT